jgi:hypothetical protein
LLPDNLKVGGDLDPGRSAITALPENLSVGGGVDLYGTAITALPDNLSVGGGLNLSGPLVKKGPRFAGGLLYSRQLCKHSSDLVPKCQPSAKLI